MIYVCVWYVYIYIYIYTHTHTHTHRVDPIVNVGFKRGSSYSYGPICSVL